MGKAAEALCGLLKDAAGTSWAATARLALLFVVLAACVGVVARMAV